MRRAARSNIVLVGMPGCGKSTIGVLLAKWLSKGFVDTDVVIQSHEGKRLQQLIRELGPEGFRRLEERHVLNVEAVDTVVATGGSVVYSELAMDHLRTHGVVLLLHVGLEHLRRRLDNLDSRGVVMEPGDTLDSLYAKRASLYNQYADITIDCDGLNHEEVLLRCVEALPRQ